MYIISRFPYTEEDPISKIFEKDIGSTGLATVGVCAVSSTTDYVFFGGGKQNKDVVAYDSTMVQCSCSTLFSVSDKLAGASQSPDQAWFAGGQYDSALSNVQTYNNELTKTNKSSLSTARYCISGASTSTTESGPVIFAGGLDAENQRSDSIDAYNRSGTKVNASKLSNAGYNIISGCVGNNAIFIGGMGLHENTLTSYTGNLVKSSKTISLTHINGSCVNVGSHLLIAGEIGNHTDGYTSALNEDLTLTSGPTLLRGRTKLGASSIGRDLALFSGGVKLGTREGDSLIDIINSDLTRIGELNFPYYGGINTTHAGSALATNNKCTFVSKYQSGYQMIACYYTV